MISGTSHRKECFRITQSGQRRVEFPCKFAKDPRKALDNEPVRGADHRTGPFRSKGFQEAPPTKQLPPRPFCFPHRFPVPKRLRSICLVLVASERIDEARLDLEAQRHSGTRGGIGSPVLPQGRVASYEEEFQFNWGGVYRNDVPTQLLCKTDGCLSLVLRLVGDRTPRWAQAGAPAAGAEHLLNGLEDRVST